MLRFGGVCGAAVVALAVLGLASAPMAQEEGEALVIDRVLVTGNVRVDQEAVRVRLRVTPGDPFDPARVDTDVRQLYRMGFFSDVNASLSSENGGWTLTYGVVERPFVGDVQVKGAKKIDEDEIETALRIRPNTIFDPEKARVGMEEVETLYEKKGYLDVAVRYEIESMEDDEVLVTFRVDEGKQIRIEKIVFEGNEAFSDRELKKHTATKERSFLSFFTGAGNLDREVLDTDTERLTAFYYENGYIDVRVDDPLIERKEDGLRVVFKIDEGGAYSFGAVEIVGETLPGLETGTIELNAETGETFRPSKLREDMNLLTEIYGNEGYAFVNVTPQTGTDSDGQSVAVGYEIARGPEVYIDRIEISGNTKTRDKVVRRELELFEQRRFSGTRLRRSQERLRRLGFFEDVNITTRKAMGEDRLDLVVDVKEGSTGSFSAGAGISSGDSFLFNVRLSEINLFGRGQRVVLSADFGTIRRNLSFSFTEPYFRDSELSLGVDAFNWRLQFDDFTRGGTGGGIRALYPFAALGWYDLWGIPLIDTRMGLEYRIEQADISDVSRNAAAVIRAEQGTSLTSSIVARIFRDTRNHPFDPTAGSLQDFSIEVAGLGGNSRFIKAESRTRWYIPLWESERFGVVTASTGWTFGYGLGYGGRTELPLFERYFPGGINSVRGYKVRSLGPQVPVFSQAKEDNSKCSLGDNLCGRKVRQDSIGGSQQLIFNNEIIFPIVQSLGVKGVVFVDAGQAYTASRGIAFTDMRVSTGFGVRWLSPIGPLRIEIGFPLNARVGDDTQTILFSFGGPP